MNSMNLEQAKKYALKRLSTELPAGLYYHGLNHTVNDVVPAAEKIAQGEGIQGNDLTLLITAAWFHDLGFIEKRIGHESISVNVALQVLPDMGYGKKQVQIICGIIMATVIPQSPITILEKIMADADLDVLGRNDFMLRNDNLRQELAFFGEKFTDLEWYTGQLKFIESHVYFTATARTLRNASQIKNTANIKKIIENLKNQSV